MHAAHPGDQPAQQGRQAVLAASAAFVSVFVPFFWAIEADVIAPNAQNTPTIRVNVISSHIGDALSARTATGGAGARAIDNARLYREAREAIRVREEFLSVASHELRTPLTALNMRVQWLNEVSQQGPVEKESMLRALDVITRQSRRLSRQVEDLLDVSRLEVGRLSLERAEVDLVDVVKDVLTSFDIGIERAKCAVTLDAPAPVRGCWDGARLDQVVSNLLANALKFGAGQPIELTLRREGERARLVIADHGMGIDPAQRERIFDRFTRAVPATHFGGLGLGLYICRELVNAHGGTISVESRLGEGATFTVELPGAS